MKSIFTNRFAVIVPGMGTSRYDADHEKEARDDYEAMTNAVPGVEFIDRAQPQPRTLKKRKRRLRRAA